MPRGDPLRTKTLVGTVLIAVGIMIFAYDSATYPIPGTEIKTGSVHARTVGIHDRIPLPLIAGAIAIGGGLVLLLAVGKRLDRAAW